VNLNVILNFYSMNGNSDVFKVGIIVHPILFNLQFVLPRMNEKISV
jgi:hypothetical protein